ncbi:1-acyl-sn-glycerol-3-phosphate acyltransferase [Tannerella sp.]|uniref:1-acyl-sn-glycerol-3-phosphate acyltransferase n=1 Tax=Tannerella sp. TaxID=2382127 RepID=UPI0026DDB9D8|nr:1-acyl-sn-glycerol-3-phosphate acyltransferase [Tannerella sp.]MDO4703559.1 1-acyl-sn-glycerol-3-phosphate acyltransferase [Tannerella sp.]
METQTPIIDVRRVLREKAPEISKKMPACVVNYLIRTIHQDELNRILERYAALDGVAFMQALIREFDLTMRLIGEKHLPPPEGRYLFVSNHPLGGLDGICLAALLGQRYGEQIRCLVNDLLLFIPNLHSIFIPINKHGAQTKKAAIQLDEAFASDRQILTFPAGLCSRKQNGRIEDTEWKKSFVRNAVKYHRDVVPVFFDGRNSDFFYRLARIRKRLGIKMNLEMLYLPDEMFRNKHQTFHVYIGKPIPWQTFDGSKKPAEWAEWVKQKVYQLSEK